MSRIGGYLAGLDELAMQQRMLFILQSSPIFIPRKHPKMKYAVHKRMKAKRKNKK